MMPSNDGCRRYGQKMEARTGLPKIATIMCDGRAVLQHQKEEPRLVQFYRSSFTSKAAAVQTLQSAAVGDSLLL